LWRALADVPAPSRRACGAGLDGLVPGTGSTITARDGAVTVSVTLTEPACLFGFRIVHEIEDQQAKLPGVREVVISIDANLRRERVRLSDRAREARAALRARSGPVAGPAAGVFVEIPKITLGGHRV
jgi:metal-sulfur cluster biosynthetic enzyme